MTHMDFNSGATDEALLEVIGARLAQLRLAQNLTQAQVAERAGLGLRTVQRLELGATATQLSGFLRVCRVLGVLGRFELLLPPPAPSPIDELKLHGRQRRRASGQTSPAPTPKKWTWGEPT